MLLPDIPCAHFACAESAKGVSGVFCIMTQPDPAPADPASAPASPAEGPACILPPRRRRVSVWRVSVIGLFVIACFATLYFASALFIPIALAILLSLLFTPLVRRLARFGVPRAVGAALAVLLLLSVIGGAGTMLAGPAAGWLERAPVNMAILRLRLKELQTPLDDVREAVAQMEKAASGGATEGAQEEPPPTVIVRSEGMVETLMSGTGQVVAEFALTLVLLYFMLAGGDLFLRKSLRFAKRRGDRKRTVEIFRRAESDISTYLVTITLINVGLGVLTGLAMWAYGLPNAMLWGALAGVLNFVPFLGALATAVVIGLVSFITFNDVGYALLPPLTFYALTAIEGQFVTPAVLGKRLTLNPVAVFLALMVWGWMWGIPGMLLAVPMLATFKIFCDNIPRLAPIGALLDRR